jgi:PST family polysaccharide transporter
MRQGTAFAIDGSALLVSTAVMVILAVAGFGPMALALSKLVGQFWTMVWQYVAVRRRPRFGWNRELARGAAAFGLPLALANVVAWSNLTLDNLVVARELSPVGLGLYALAFNVASWPMSIAGQSVRVVALPAFSRLGSMRARARAMVTVCGPIWAVSLVLAVGLMATAGPVVSVLYGARWRGAEVAIVPLAAFGALRVVFDLMATFLIASGRTRSVLWVQVAWVVVLGPAMLIGVRLGGLAGAGWAHTVVGLGVVLPAYFIALSGVQVRVGPVLRAWVLPSLAIVPLALVLFLGVRQVANPYLAMSSAALAGVLLYVLPIAPWALRQFRELSRSNDETSTAESSAALPDDAGLGAAVPVEATSVLTRRTMVQPELSA